MDNLVSMLDEQLVSSYAAGNKDAFDEILLRHKQSLYNYIFFTVRNAELAEDIFQETFVKVITTIQQGKYVETGKFKAWITRIAHNLIIDHLRQEGNANTISNETYDFDLFNNASLCEETIETEIVKKQIINDVRKLVRFLPDLQREVLEMRYYQNLSFKEIAERTGVSLNTALGRMRYAILNMRKMVEEHRMTMSA